MSDTTESVETEQLSLREELSKVHDTLSQEETSEEVVEETEVEATEEAEVEEEGVQVAEDKIIPPLEAKDEEEVEEETTSPEDEEAYQPLEHWHREHKEMFAKLDPEAQKFLIDRDKEFQASVTQKQMEVADMKRALEPIKDQLEERGISQGNAIRLLVGAHLRLERDPKNAILELMNSYGIDINAIVGDDVEGRSDLSESAVALEVKKLKEELRQEREARQAVEATRVTQRLQEFAGSHEYFDDVVQDMTDLANGYRARGQEPPPLETLYEKACRMNESVWEKISSAKRQEEESKRRERDKAEAAKAKRAASTKVRSTASRSGESKKEGRSLRQELSDTYDKLQQAR